jgi:acetyl esterase/lipase
MKKHSTEAATTHETPANERGLIQIPSMQLPLSCYMSSQARQAFISRSFNPPELREAMKTSDIQVLRATMDTHLFEPMVAKAMVRYPVKIKRDCIQGVPVSIIEPMEGISPDNQHRILINLHGGFFTVGAGGKAGLLESIPIAALQRITVISVDYRQGPEYRFPAASEDVSLVYQSLLASYPPQNIGIFGASAGGMLTAMTMAWLQREKLPAPGAIALLSAGATASMAGDSQFIASASMGETPPPPSAHSLVMPVVYLAGVDPDNPLVTPASDPAVLEKFPPTLLITGTRAFDLSATVHTHRCLRRAGVPVDMQLWEGMWHCFFYDTELPESTEAYTILAHHFADNLGSQP